ncbi:spherulation-specific family 4 protein [Aquisphaera insulae]|uniref:spherulation-specific family 4 protein n=1 Tax=Aquisphaera insulae TaxID=2712864 RepID=UPI0013ED6F24|nr:spherulation-specific family 4 protein [Aquisphaera insulae]
MISVACSCGRRFKAEDHHAGKRTRCPVCGNMLVIGQPGTTTPSSPPIPDGMFPSGVVDNGEIPSWWFPAGNPAGTRPTASSVAAPPVTHSGSHSGSGTGSASSGDPDEVQTAVFPQQPGVATGPGRAGAGPRRKAILAAGIAALLLGGAAFVWLPSLRPRRESPPGTPDRPVGGGVPKAAPDASDTTGPGAADEPNASPALAGGGPRLRLLVPAYFYPAGEGLNDWRRLAAAAAKVKVVAVANPDSGPGNQRNPDYARAIREAHDAGIVVIGYVNTRYGARPVAEIQADLDRWVEFYPPIGGFFLDQQSTDARKAPAYIEIRDAARRKIKDALVVNNPGTTCDEAYITRQCSDATCVFADFQGFTDFKLPSSYGHRDPSRFAALAYQVKGADAMRQVVHGAILKRIGYLYVSDTPKGDNPWGRLPSYWEDEVNEIHRTE